MKNLRWLELNKKKSTKKREAYFLDYIDKARKITNKPLMLTGGFRSAKIMEQALIEDKLDIIGLARPFCLYTNLAKDILSGNLKYVDTPLPSSGIKMLDKLGGVELPWYELQIHRIGEGKKPNKKLSGLAAFIFSLKNIIFKSFIKN